MNDYFPNRIGELTFKASVDDMGRIGSVKLGKTEVERFRSAMEPTGKHIRWIKDLGLKTILRHFKY